MTKTEFYRPIGTIEIVNITTGEVLSRTHNMIVEGGRRLIIKAIFGGQTLTKTNFKIFAESNNPNLTEPTTSYKDIKSNIKYISELKTYKVSSSMNADETKNVLPTVSSTTGTGDESSIDETNINIKMDLLINPETFIQITSIGLYYDNDSEDKILFSRALLNAPVSMSKDYTYIVHYTLQF